MRLIRFLNSKYFVVIYCFLLFSYVVFRAYALSFTFDEVTTSQIANGDNWSDFGGSANNHFLNICLIKLSTYLLGFSEFTYRLPNVLSFAFYLLFLWKLVVLLLGQIRLLPILLLTSMPFVLDFFSLARGYGLALGLIMPSVYYLLKYIKTKNFVFAVPSLLFASAAVLANFTSFNFYIPFLIVLFGFTFLIKVRMTERLISLLTISCAFLALVLPVAFELKDRGELYFGGSSGFFRDTILSLGRGFAYHQINIVFSQVLFALLFAISLFFSVTELTIAVKSTKNRGSIPAAFSILFLLSLSAPILNHILFDTKFPVERTGILYYVLMMLVLCTSNKPFSFFKYKTHLKTGFAILFTVQFLISLNSSKSYSWRYDSATKELISILKDIGEQNKDKEVTLGIDYLHSPSVGFYRSQNDFHSLLVRQVLACWEFNMNLEELDPLYYGSNIERKENLTVQDADKLFAGHYDYYYFNNWIIDRLQSIGYGFNIVKSFPNANTSLISLEKTF